MDQSLVQALKLVKLSLENGNVQNAIELLDTMIAQAEKLDDKATEATLPTGRTISMGEDPMDDPLRIPDR